MHPTSLIYFCRLRIFMFWFFYRKAGWLWQHPSIAVFIVICFPGMKNNLLWFNGTFNTTICVFLLSVYSFTSNTLYSLPVFQRKTKGSWQSLLTFVTFSSKLLLKGIDQIVDLISTLHDAFVCIRSIEVGLRVAFSGDDSMLYYLLPFTVKIRIAMIRVTHNVRIIRTFRHGYRILIVT